MQISLEQLDALLKTLDDKKVAEFEYEDDAIRLRISLARAVASNFPPGAASNPPSREPIGSDSVAPKPSEVDPSVVYVTSPFVGTFYRASSPETENFAEVGVSVKKGQTLCIIEAMKLMNEIDAEYACTVLEILVENGKSVEFGQKLFKVKKA